MLWIRSVACGVLPLDRLIEWADREIMRLEQPPLWLLKLSTARNVDGLRDALDAVEEDRQAPNRWHRNEAIFLGGLYLVYENGQLSIGELLKRAGKFADGSGGGDVPDCEAFYAQLNEGEGYTLERSGIGTLEDRVSALFQPMVRTVQDAFGKADSSALEIFFPDRDRRRRIVGGE